MHQRSPATRWVPGLDGLRALAIVAVLLYHGDVPWMPGGFLGVDLFFVISGFLITRLLLADTGRSPRAALAEFYRRRVRRLLPALLALLVVTVVAMRIAAPADLLHDRGDGLASLGFTANWWFVLHHQSYFASIGRPSPFRHLWSLGVEEQFYLLWPLLVLVVLGRLRPQRRRGALLAVALAGAAVSAGWMTLLAVRTGVPLRADASRVYYGTDTHAFGLLLGAAAAVVAPALSRPRLRVVVRRLAEPVLLLALAGLVWAAVAVSEFSAGLYRGGFVLYAVAAVAAVLTAPHARGLAGRLVRSRAVSAVGARSYGLYLWHWPVFVLTRPGLDLPLGWRPDLGLRLGATAVVAELSYRLIEQPIRRRGMAALTGAVGRWVTAPVALVTAAAMVLTMAEPVTRAPVLVPAAVELPAPPPGFGAALRALSAERLPTAPGATARSTHRHAARHHRARPQPLATLRVSMFGDSVMLGARWVIERRLPGAVVDAREGWQPWDAIPVMRELAAAGKVRPVVVVHTGDNGVIDPKLLSGLLASLRQRCVVLVTDHIPDRWEQYNNREIDAAAKRSPNVMLADWDALVRHHPGWLWSDGVHLRPAGAAAYSALVTRAVRALAAARHC